MLKKLALTGVLLGCGGVLAAQSPAPQFDLTGALLWSQNSLTKVTHDSLAYGVGGGLKVVLPKVDVPVKIGLAYYAMPGKESGTIRSSLALTQAYTDFYLDSKLPGWVFKFGLSANHYTVSNKGTEAWAPDGNDPYGDYAPQSAWAVTDTHGLKLGYRLGTEYTWSRHWGAELLFQLTELSGGQEKTIQVSDGQGGTMPQVVANLGPVNPSWVQLGLRYTF